MSLKRPEAHLDDCRDLLVSWKQAHPRSSSNAPQSESPSNSTNDQPRKRRKVILSKRPSSSENSPIDTPISTSNDLPLKVSRSGRKIIPKRPLSPDSTPSSRKRNRQERDSIAVVRIIQ